MIKSFKSKDTEKIWNGVVSKKLPADIQKRALVKLLQIDAAKNLEDLKLPPSNNLEVLKGDRGGYYSIRINRQWRVCFGWSGHDAQDVQIVDYH